MKLVLDKNHFRVDILILFNLHGPIRPVADVLQDLAHSIGSLRHLLSGWLIQLLDTDNRLLLGQSIFKFLVYVA